MIIARIVILTIALGTGSFAAYAADASGTRPTPVEPIAQSEQAEALARAQAVWK